MRHKFSLAFVATFTVFPLGSAIAQVGESGYSLPLALAVKAATKAIATCASNGYPVSAVVVDPLRSHQARGQGRPLDRPPHHVSLPQAYTVVTFGRSFGSTDGRVRVPEPAWRSRHPDRSVLRLPHQRHQLSRVERLATAESAAHAGYLGLVRPLVPGCRDGRLSARSARGGGPHPRCRPLCALREARRDRKAGWRFSGTHAQSTSRPRAMTATVSASASAVAHSANG